MEEAKNNVEGLVCIAGIPIRIEPMYPESLAAYQDYVTDRASRVTVSVTRQRLEEEREKLNEMTARFPGRFISGSDAELDELAVYHQIAELLPQYHAVLFHGSAISVDGQGYLFTAPSGTGKSTHTRLWRETFGNRAVMINDDRPILRAEGDAVWVYGSPWRGKHRIGANRSVPLKAICLLTRSEENRIEKVSLAEAYSILLKYSFQLEAEKYQRDKLYLLEKMISHLHFYRLACTMDPEAAMVAYRGMQE